MIACERYYSVKGCRVPAMVLVRLHSRYVELTRYFCQGCADEQVAKNSTSDLQATILGPISLTSEN